MEQYNNETYSVSNAWKISLNSCLSIRVTQSKTHLYSVTLPDGSKLNIWFHPEDANSNAFKKLAQNVRAETRVINNRECWSQRKIENVCLEKFNFRPAMQCSKGFRSLDPVPRLPMSYPDLPLYITWLYNFRWIGLTIWACFLIYKKQIPQSIVRVK